MPESGKGPTYRDELAAAYQRIADLEARNRDLEATLARRDGPVFDHVRDLDASLARWDRVRATLAMLLGFTGLFALRIADHWSVRAALLSACAAMVTVGIILAWPKVVRANVDPKPYARDVSRPWRKKRREGERTRVRVAAVDPARRGEIVELDASAERERGARAAGRERA